MSEVKSVMIASDYGDVVLEAANCEIANYCKVVLADESSQIAAYFSVDKHPKTCAALKALMAAMEEDKKHG